ncbi:MAG: hypothetical protein HZB91_03850 [Elusimicrobia bacterium]|nr:hypothetical protein [Elusimicrobiota bacterium]
MTDRDSGPEREEPPQRRDSERGGSEPGFAAGGAGYTPLPDLEPKPKQRRIGPLAAAGLALVLGLGGLGVWHVRKPEPPAEPANISAQAPAPASVAQVLAVGRAEFDRAATEAAREALKRGDIPPVLAQASPELRREVAEARMDLFSIRLVDSAAEDGDVVVVSVDGKTLGRVNLSNAGAVLTLPLKPGASTSLKVLAEKDGGGGVTFGAVTSQGQVMSKVMSVGESQDWTVEAR